MGLNSEPEEESIINHVSIDGPFGREKIEDLLSALREREDESNITNHESADDPSDGRVKMKDLFSAYIEQVLAENYHSTGYPTPILNDDLFDRQMYHEMIHETEFPYIAFLSFGLANFMSYAAHFCKYEAQNKAEIISIGSGDGAVDREIISTYRKHFGEEIKITLVDPDPDYEVDFKTVDDLIEARPEAVGNCILLIIWPEPKVMNNGYDIDAVRKLQPRAALVLYEPTGVSASEELTRFVRSQTKETVESDDGYDSDEYDDYDERTVGLENYAVEKVTGLDVHFKAGRKVETAHAKFITPPATRQYCLRLLKLKKL